MLLRSLQNYLILTFLILNVPEVYSKEIECMKKTPRKWTQARTIVRNNVKYMRHAPPPPGFNRFS